MNATGINKVLLVGYLGHEPSLGKTKGTDAPVCSMRIATTNEKGRTEWHRVVAHGHLATRCKEYLEKGRRVYVEGHLKTRRSKPTRGVNKGVEMLVTEIVAHEVKFLDTRTEREGAGT